MSEDRITDLIREEIIDLKATLDELYQLTAQADSGTAAARGEDFLREYSAVMDRHSVEAFTVSGGKKFTRYGLAARLEFLLESFDDELTGWAD